MKNQTCIWSEEPSHLKGRISEDREALNTKHNDVDKHRRWLKNSMWMCRNMQHPLPPPMTTFMMSVIKDGGLGCTGCAPANEIWNRASEHMSREWLIRGIYCENLNEILAKSIFEEPYVSAEGVGAGGQQLADVLLIEQHNRPDSVNQLYRRNKFRLTAHFL